MWPVLYFKCSEQCIYCNRNHFLCSWLYFTLPCWTCMLVYLRYYQIQTLWVVLLNVPRMIYCCNWFCGFCCDIIYQRFYLLLFLLHHLLFQCQLCCREWWFLFYRHNVYYVVLCNWLVELIFSICSILQCLSSDSANNAPTRILIITLQNKNYQFNTNDMCVCVDNKSILLLLFLLLN